jgi:hypothetical protein
MLSNRWVRRSLNSLFRSGMTEPDENQELSQAPQEPDPLLVVKHALDRTTPLLNPIGALIDGMRRVSESERVGPLDALEEFQFAIGFDTNALFRLGLNGQSGAAAVDYLTGMHTGPVIVPGQAIQETWKNALSGMEPSGKRVHNALTSLETELRKLDMRSGPILERARASVDELRNVHSDWIDAESQDTFIKTLEALAKKASCPYVPRGMFQELARIRNDTKTPPGFEDPDDNHGDFYLWADFLYGLAMTDLESVRTVVLVTNDVKPDWSRGGVPHPILVQEVELVTGRPFVMCTVKEFQAWAKKVTS